MIKLGIKGDDGWNFTELELIVNGKAIYKKKFSKSGQWIDSNNKKHPKTFLVGTTALRYSPNWRYNSYTKNIYRAPAIIPVDMIKSMVESAVGNSLQEVSKITWGKKYGKEYISVKRINANTLRFDLDLKHKITTLPDMEVDVDFDLVFSCEDGVIRTKITNYKSVSYGASKYLTEQISLLNHSFSVGCNLLIIDGVVNYCQKGLNKIDKWLDFNFYYNGSNDIGLSKACSGKMKLDSEGNLYLNSNTNKRKSRKAIDRTRTTVMVSRFQSKN
jgi:hypothetical protein